MRRKGKSPSQKEETKLSSRRDHFVPSDSMERAIESSDSFKACPTTGPIFVNSNTNSDVSLELPENRQIKTLNKIISDLDRINPNESIIFFSSDLSHNLFPQFDFNNPAELAKVQFLPISYEEMELNTELSLDWYFFILKIKQINKKATNSNEDNYDTKEIEFS